MGCLAVLALCGVLAGGGAYDSVPPIGHDGVLAPSASALVEAVSSLAVGAVPVGDAAKATLMECRHGND